MYIRTGLRNSNTLAVCEKEIQENENNLAGCISRVEIFPQKYSAEAFPQNIFSQQPGNTTL